MLNKFAKELKEAREKSGISLQQIAVKTRIDLKFLEAIERGDFHFLPELYVKAFLKQYAKVIGLDEDEIAEKYVAAKEGKLLDAAGENDEEVPQTGEQKPKATSDDQKPAVTTFSENEKKPEQSTVRKNQNLAIFGAIAGAFTLILLVYFFFIKNGSDIVVEEKPYNQVVQENTSRYVEEKPKTEKEQKTVQSAIEELSLTITNTDSTDSAWVLVIYDDSRQEDFMLFPHKSKTVKTNNNFKLTLGNSGVISLKLNDVKLEFKGKRRAVKYLKVDKNGIEQLHSPPKLTRE